jgi:hypothetical protein
VQACAAPCSCAWLLCRAVRCRHSRPTATCLGPLPNVPQVVAATPLTTLAGPGHPNPSPLRLRGYFTDAHGGGTFSRAPSLLFGRLGDRSKPVSGGATLPTVGAWL